ncbi:cytochrome b/b6 domain-containing protein [Geomonas ferrireducens]|uniref:cytochrome b/b6 domain-containing protein n=1 Tax=Geomonas ferrireducens TaxID=2570227 RepID=UPI0010A77D2C|nr:cytochrome b/b6 domain-containing protein [Geomonas ferrireducens]
MSLYDIPESEIRIELEDPVPFGRRKRRELLIAAALGAPFGTDDPVDLALLSAASKKEDLRHYEQLAFTPLEPRLARSVARVRRVDSGEEALIARGEVDGILYLCHPDEATRYRAEMQAEMRMTHGFRALGIGRGSVAPDGSERWDFLGYIPVRATRRKSRRIEEPAEFRYVPVWDWQLRVLHWFSVFLILVLSATGLLMGSGRLVYGGAEGFTNYLSWLRLVHFVAGWLLLCAAILRIAGLFLASNQFQRWYALFPVRMRDLKNLVQVALNYLFCRFDRPPHYIGHNPLQQVAYTAIFGVGLLALFTGFALYALYDPGNIVFRYFVMFDDLVGVQYVRLVHQFVMWIFLAFIPIHVYLSVRADTVEREGALSSIVSGGRWCRKGTHFEDA